MGEIQSVIELYVEVQDWEEAFVWADKHPEYRQLVYVPYATSLAEQDKFLQAQKGRKSSAVLFTGMSVIYCEISALVTF